MRRLNFPRLLFIVLIGGALSLCVWLGVIGYRYGQRSREIRERWAASRPATEPATMPIAELVDQIEIEREKQLAKANRFGAKSSELYLYCAVLTVLWGIAAVKTWKRRWPGDRN